MKSLVSYSVTTNTDVSPQTPIQLLGVTDLVSVLLQCFVLILVGYISGRCGLIKTKHSKGLSIFVTYFSLPTLIFKTLSTSDLSSIRWSLVSSILVSKSIIFILVIFVTLILTKPWNYGLAGLYGILCTQSNDFAVGYPLMVSLYRSTHPEFANYLYVLAPIQLAILNPIGLVLMQIYKHYNDRTQSHTRLSIFECILNTIKNPIILMTVLGIVWNLAFDHSVPPVLCPLLDVLSQSFSACALFLLGLNLCGKFQLINSSYPILMVSLVLVMTKILLFPLLTRFVIQKMMNSNDSQEFSNFGFLYGTIPSAPTVFIFALQYQMSSTVVSAAMVISTILSAPLMFVSANMIRIASNSLPYTAFKEDLGYTMCYSSLFSMCCLIWVIMVLLCGYKWKSVTHRCTLALAISQLSIAIGGHLWQYIDKSGSIQHFYMMYHFQYIFAVGGTLSSRIWTSMLSITLALLHWKSLCYVIQIHRRLALFAFLVTLSFLLLVIYVPNYPTDKNIDPNFEFGLNQAFIAIFVLILSLVVTVAGLIIQHYFRSRLYYTQTLNINDNDIETDTEHESLLQNEEQINATNNEQSNTQHIPKRIRTFSRETNTSTDLNRIIEVEDLISSDHAIKDFCNPLSNCSTAQKKECMHQIRRYRHQIQEANEVLSLFNSDSIVDRYSANFHQIYHHVFLLLTLILSMLIGLVVSIGKVVLEKPTGIFIELEFLDIILNYGQGVVTFLIFGLEISPVYDQISKLLWNKQLINTLHLPPIECISDSTKQLCDQFNTFHKQNCMNDILFDQNGCSIFRGTDLVNWLIATGVCQHKKQAEYYGRHLLIGRVIQHLNKNQHFHDSSFLYKFVT